MFYVTSNGNEVSVSVCINVLNYILGFVIILFSWLGVLFHFIVFPCPL